MTTKMQTHPAKFSPEILEVLDGILPAEGVVLDPFAGVGGIHDLQTAERWTIGVEIEPEWAAAHLATRVGSALNLTFFDETFDAVATSPCYGNRMADSHDAQDGSYRRSYTHDLRRLTGDPERKLHPDNSGLMQWGPEYQAFHALAWAECYRVLKPGGMMVVNISDHIRGGEAQGVHLWHAATLGATGFEPVMGIPVATKRHRRGENHEARVGEEWVLVFEKGIIHP
jgi:DNA modification methylase